MLQFTVNGMTCGGCARAVTNAIKSVDEAATVRVDLASKRVTVRVDLASKRVTVETAADSAKVGSAIEEAGYAVEVVAA